MSNEDTTPAPEDLANALRVLAFDAVQAANSGHPGAPMGLAETCTALWREHLFVWMYKNGARASDFFRIPANRVVELGTQVEI